MNWTDWLINRIPPGIRKHLRESLRIIWQEDVAPPLRQELNGIHERLNRLEIAVAQMVSDPDPGPYVGDGLLRRAPIPPGDDAPLPPAVLRKLVAGTEDLQWFLESGQRGVQTIIEVLAKQQMTIGQFESILDFGCGCGRVIRHLRPYETVQLHGSDCNRVAIRWCDENLQFAEFSTNPLQPPTRYRPGSFDLIYAFSVFTHLTEDLQIPWIQELHRILRPNGYLILTVHGDHYLSHVPAAGRDAYQQGRLVVVGADKVGLNECSAFHPGSYVRNVLAGEIFEVIDFLPEGALGNPRQDVYLLKTCQG